MRLFSLRFPVNSIGALLLPLFGRLAVVVDAHRQFPLGVTCTSQFASPSEALQIPEPTISWATYRLFTCADDDVDVFWMDANTVKVEQWIKFTVGIPALDRFRNVTMTTVLMGPMSESDDVAGLPSGIQDYLAANPSLGVKIYETPNDISTCNHLSSALLSRFTVVEDDRCVFHEEYSGTSSWILIDDEYQTSTIGDYKIALFSSSGNTAKAYFACCDEPEDFLTNYDFPESTCEYCGTLQKDNPAYLSHFFEQGSMAAYAGFPPLLTCSSQGAGDPIMPADEQCPPIDDDEEEQQDQSCFLGCSGGLCHSHNALGGCLYTVKWALAPSVGEANVTEVSLFKGDSIKFDSKGLSISHDLYEFQSSQDLENCNFDNNSTLLANVEETIVSHTVKFDSAGFYYFTCGIGCKVGSFAGQDFCHCEAGMVLTVEVKDATEGLRCHDHAPYEDMVTHDASSSSSSLDCGESVLVHAVGPSDYGCSVDECCVELCASPAVMSLFVGVSQGGCSTVDGFMSDGTTFEDTTVQPPGSPVEVSVRIFYNSKTPVVAATVTALQCADGELNAYSLGPNIYGCEDDYDDCCSEMCTSPAGLTFLAGAEEGNCLDSGGLGVVAVPDGGVSVEDITVQPPGSPVEIPVRLFVANHDGPSSSVVTKTCHCHSYEQIRCPPENHDDEDDPLYSEHIDEIEMYCAPLLMTERDGTSPVNSCPYKCFQPMEVLHLHYIECPDRPPDPTFVQVNLTLPCHVAAEAPEDYAECPIVELWKDPLSETVPPVQTTTPTAPPTELPKSNSDLNGLYEWTQVLASAEWEARAGLEAVQLDDGDLFVIAGRTPKKQSNPVIPGDSIIHGDVWKSSDLGKSWDRIASDTFPPRAYHEAIVKNNTIYVLGGQDFNVTLDPLYQDEEELVARVEEGEVIFLGPTSLVDKSQFFNDVWSSSDRGVSWTQLTANAGWQGRAGHSAIVFKDEIYVMGGSTGNDESLVDLGTPARKYFNDVWKSVDGVQWIQVTDAAPWAPRAGAAVTVLGDALYVLGGEVGFIGFPPPYFNDVWKTKDGATWEIVTESAGWSPRPGHLCHTLHDRIFCFGGFGQSSTPGDFSPSNPMDLWESADGVTWNMMDVVPWNADSPGEIKYDFDSIVVNQNGTKAIYTFGGDRETFDFSDLSQFLNVDNDVWRFGGANPEISTNPPTCCHGGSSAAQLMHISFYPVLTMIIVSLAVSIAA